MEPQELKNAITEYYASIDKHDYDAVANYMADNHQFHFSMAPDGLMNKEQHLGMMQQFETAFSDGAHRLTHTIAEGEFVVVNGNWTGKHTGAWDEIPASGNNMDFGFTNIFRFENGKVVEERATVDSLTMMIQMGAVPAPNPSPSPSENQLEIEKGLVIKEPYMVDKFYLSNKIKYP